VKPFSILHAFRRSHAKADHEFPTFSREWGQFAPLALWQAQCKGRGSGQLTAAGHLIPEELPAETAAASRPGP
jgi:hypothetical protein